MSRCLSLLLLLLFSIGTYSQQHPLRLWYNAPATYWEASVPLGNGRLLLMEGQLNNGTDGKGMLYKVKLQVQANGGQVIAANNSLQIKNANSAIIYLSAGTSYKAPAYAATKNTQIKKNNKISNTSNDTIRVNMRPGETVKLVFEV